MKQIKRSDNLQKAAQTTWDAIREQLTDVTDNEKQAALLEILALRTMALAYKQRAEHANLSPLSSKRGNKSFVR